ncbi:hypothetical protein TNCV_1520271 [Trichonephila clavipes]|nr:hypothetical protein TNCV_1520271 [Trichonephila clavipes]
MEGESSLDKQNWLVAQAIQESIREHFKAKWDMLNWARGHRVFTSDNSAELLLWTMVNPGFSSSRSMSE